MRELVELGEGPRLEQVLDETYGLWGDGLSRKAYGLWNLAQMKTVWGKAHLSRVGLMDGDHVVASAKRYLFGASIGGQPTRLLGIGAVFTESSRRGQGLAPQLIDAMIADGQTRGCTAALLFSEIGAAYYERLGFTVVPRQMATIEVPHTRRGAPATMVRAADVHDYPEIASISMTYARDASFALDRTADLIEFGVTRRRLRAGLGPDGLRQVEVFVAEEGYRAAAYIIVTRGPEGVVLEDCGDRDPSGARLGALLEAYVERDPSRVDRTFRAWLPPDLRPPQVRLSAPFDAPEIMMVRELPGHPATRPSTHPPIRRLTQPKYWPLDVF